MMPEKFSKETNDFLAKTNNDLDKLSDEISGLFDHLILTGAATEDETKEIETMINRIEREFALFCAKHNIQ